LKIKQHPLAENHQSGPNIRIGDQHGKKT